MVFCGSIFSGDKTNLLEFSQLIKNKCLQLIEKDKHLMWEVNIWFLVWNEHSELFNIYIADYNSNFQLENGGISYNELSKKVRKTVNIIPKTSYLNFMKYAYVNKEVRKYIPK